MKIRLLFLLFLIPFVIQSCRKDNSYDVAPDNRQKQLTMIIENKGDVTITTTLAYDEKKRLSSIKSGRDISLYSYTDDKLTRLEVVEGEMTTSTEINYKDNYPLKAISKIYVSSVLKRELTYEYLATLSQTGQINVYENGRNIKRLYYESLNANILSILEVANRSFTNYDYQYGSRKNVFFNAYIRWPLGIEKVDRVSTNEILSERTESSTKNHLKAYRYTYDTDGLPLSAVVTETNPPSKLETKSTITYTYEYL